MATNLLSTGKSAKYLGISKWTLRRWVAVGRIKPKLKKKNGYLAFDKEDLDALMSKGEHKKYKKRRKSEVGSQKSENVSPKETQLLPSPKEEQATVVVEEQKVLIVPNVKKGKTGVFGVFRRWFGSPKKLTVLLLAVLSFASFRTATVVTHRYDQVSEMSVDEGTVLSLQAEKKAKSGWLDTILAAASDASTSGANSVTFLMSENENVNQLFDETETPPTGNSAYNGAITSYPMWSDSPYPYLSGERGVAGPVAIIEKADSLVVQPFFANVHDGDKLFIYKTANRAILFRPLTNSVVAFGELDSVAGENPFVSGLTTVPNQVTFVLRSGMPGDQDMKVFESDLRFRIPDATVVSTERAMRSDYKKTVLIDATHGAKLKAAQEYARKLGISLIDLPQEEPFAPAGVDFIVIVGTDRK